MSYDPEGNGEGSYTNGPLVYVVIGNVVLLVLTALAVRFVIANAAYLWLAVSAAIARVHP